MRFYPVANQACTLILLGLLLGCADSEPPAAPPPPEDPREPEVDLGVLPELGDYMSGLDGGRLDVAPPQDWALGSRTKGYVVRFLASEQQQYPMILVTGTAYQGTGQISADNVTDFARHVKEEESVSGPVEPIVVGRFVGVTYRKRGKEPGSLSRILERLLIVTVVAGRKYTVELRAREGHLDESRQSLLAVVGGIRFLEAAAEQVEPDEAVAETTDDVGEKPKEKPKPAEKGLQDLLN